MTIKEFALLAGVSVSTVSKIMNGKDASISARTRGARFKAGQGIQLCPLCICHRAHDPDADHGRDLSEY